MIKPTKHYEGLRQGLEGYKHDDYHTLLECVAHIFLDIRVWAQSHGLDLRGATAAHRLALQLELEQLEQVESQQIGRH